MKNLLLAAAVLGLVGASGDVADGGAFYSGNSLYELSKSNRPAFSGYVAGVRDTHRIHDCSPATVTLGQMVDVVEKALANNPAYRDRAADVLIIAALLQAWPCPEGDHGPAPTPNNHPGPGRQSL